MRESSLNKSNNNSSNNAASSVCDFFMEKLNISRLFQIPLSAAFVDDRVRQSWDNIRKSVFKMLFTKMIPTILEYELKRDLLRMGRDAIVEEAGSNFTNRFLSVGPFR